MSNITKLPVEPYLSDERLLTALTVYREARGESQLGKLGVVWVLRNRCGMAPAQGFKPTLAANILKPWAFSSFNANDPNADKYPEATDISWQHSLSAVDSIEPDPTDGAVFYYSRPITEPPHAWGAVVPTSNIGNLHFCKVVP